MDYTIANLVSIPVTIGFLLAALWVGRHFAQHWFGKEWPERLGQAIGWLVTTGVSYIILWVVARAVLDWLSALLRIPRP